MQRSSIIALVLGALVSAIVIALHAVGVTLPLEEAVMSLLARGHETTKVVGVKAQYALVVLLSFGVVWLVSKTSNRKRLGWPLGIFAVELIAAAWVCALYGVFFQPIPALLAVALGFAAAYGYAAFGGKITFRREMFAGRMTEKTVEVLPAGDFAAAAKTYEVTAVVCDIANKHDLAEEQSPAEYAATIERFIREMTDSFAQAGAYIESAAGEGVVALFGFPNEDQGQAEKATRHALALIQAKRNGNGANGTLDEVDVHLGISSGTIIAVPIQRNGSREMLTIGEPVELARRFCIANRFYGSRVLVGPRTFESASETILARPIDFLTGVDVRERHEIYEPLSLAADATPEQIARRDSFWNGVVLYREKRWGEAYAEFQKARGADGEEDAPLQLYLRRIEPLALQLAMSQDD
ncbi:MAG: adenylate/guanylate cyclase domain-containing protein [Chthoniobacterales bacterium]